MVASFLQDCIAEELKKIFEGFQLMDPKGNMRDINIFRQNLPMPEAEMQTNIPCEQLENGLAEEIPREDPYPYIIVRIEDGEIKDEASTQTVNTILVIGIYDGSYDKHGSKDVMNVIQKIYERFAKHPVLGKKYTIQYPIKWMLQEEESYPYYFGGMALIWETAAIRREDEYA